MGCDEIADLKPSIKAGVTTLNIRYVSGKAKPSLSKITDTRTALNTSLN